MGGTAARRNGQSQVPARHRCACTAAREAHRAFLPGLVREGQLQHAGQARVATAAARDAERAAGDLDLVQLGREASPETRPLAVGQAVQLQRAALAVAQPQDPRQVVLGIAVEADRAIDVEDFTGDEDLRRG